ncbi:MAG: TadE/TadG family type IV pilus assembly protein [Planctomycetota bacterium]
MQVLRPSIRRIQRGAVLVEFALVSIVFYLLLAGTVELGRLMVMNQALQDAARIAAREFALAPFPASATFEQALYDALQPVPSVNPPIFDPRALVVDMTDLPAGTDPTTVFATLPVVNQSLQLLMFRDEVTVEGQRRDVYRMPGTLLINDAFAQMPLPTNPLGLTVQVPRIIGRGPGGGEIIEWTNVLEEVRANNSFVAAGTGSFSLTPPNPGQESGMAAVRLNLPFQSVLLGSFYTDADGSSAGPMEATGVQTVTNPQDQNGRLAIDSADSAGTYGGEYGLGGLHMLGTQIRPFRRVISAQSMFRREVFQ